MAELVENDLVVLYQVGKHRYYSLTRWNQWQSISSQKMVPSKYPAPPVEVSVAVPVALPALEADKHSLQGNAGSSPSVEILEATKQVAAILKLSVSDALARIVADYLQDPGLSLFGEADAAREWIEDPQRNRKHQQLTPAFFRRWLKREQESSRISLTRSHSPPGKSVSLPASSGQRVANGAGPPGCTNEDLDPYHAFVEQRARALLLRTKGEDGYAQTS